MSNYGRIRKDKVDNSELIKIFQDSCSSIGIDISYNNLFKIFTIMVSTAAKYLYDNPTKRIDFPHFDLIRSSCLDNLIRIDIKKDKDVKNAEDLLGFNLSEGFDRRKLVEAMDEFVENLIDYSEKAEEKNNKLIKELRDIEKERKKKG